MQLQLLFSRRNHHSTKHYETPPDKQFSFSPFDTTLFLCFLITSHGSEDTHFVHICLLICSPVYFFRPKSCTMCILTSILLGQESPVNITGLVRDRGALHLLQTGWGPVATDTGCLSIRLKRGKLGLTFCIYFGLHLGPRQRGQQICSRQCGQRAKIQKDGSELRASGFRHGFQGILLETRRPEIIIVCSRGEKHQHRHQITSKKKPHHFSRFAPKPYSSHHHFS